MRTALDRLLAQPLALRALRSIITNPEFPPVTYLPNECQCRAFRLAKIPRGVSPKDRKKANSDGASFKRKEDIIPEIKTPKTQTYEWSAWKEFHFQSDVTKATPGSQDSGEDVAYRSLLVDQPGHRSDYALWSRILQFRTRVYGSNGVKQVWDGMRQRGIDLPTEGEHAEYFWKTFYLSDGRKTGVVDYAEDLRDRTGRYYARLYELVLGYWLKENPDIALRWHLRLKDKFRPPASTLRRLFPAIQYTGSKLAVLKRLYLDLVEADLYDTVIPRLVDLGRYKDAREWHRLMLAKGDLPTTKEIAGIMEGHVKLGDLTADNPPDRLAHLGQDALIPPPKPETRHDAGETNEATKMKAGTNHLIEFSRELAYSSMGDAHAVAPKRFDDRFCARLFATRAFSLDAIISGLGMLGVQSIGSVPLREMAARTTSPIDLEEKFERLKAAGISIAESVFSRALHKFAKEDRGDLIKELINSDQHPDVLEDRSLQRRLLASYVAAEDWTQVHRSLLILTLFHDDPVTESWNLLLNVRTEAGTIDKVSDLLEDMLTSRIHITGDSLDRLQKYRLRPRHVSKRPITYAPNYVDYDDLRFMANFQRHLLFAGGNINPFKLREILRRYGMTYRLSELEDLCGWLSLWYSPATAEKVRDEAIAHWPSTCSRPGMITPGIVSKPSLNLYRGTLRAISVPLYHPQHPLSELFPPSFQTAVIEWGFLAAFRAPIPTERQPKHDWAWGLRLLRKLRDRGVLVPRPFVAKIVRRRLLMLFGPITSHRKINWAGKKNCPYSLQEMVKVVEEIWGKDIFAMTPNRNRLGGVSMSQEEAVTPLSTIHKVWPEKTTINRAKRQILSRAKWTRMLSRQGKL